MFITEDINPGQLLAELLKVRRVRPETTARFAKLKHDEHLCPKLTEHVKSMLEIYAA